MTLHALRQDHGQMITIGQSILDLATSQQDDAMVLLQAHRIDLSRAVASHCAAEVAQLQSLVSDTPASAEKAALLRQYHSDLLAWRGALMECNANWPTRRITEDRKAFSEAFGAIVEQLVERVRWEEREFYPAFFGVATAH